MKMSFFMFYNVLLFSVKKISFIKFMASLILTPLIIQRQSQLIMFKIAISLRVIDITNKL